MRPIIHVTRPPMPPYEEYCAEIRDLWESRWLTNQGEKQQKLQSALQDYLGVRHIELVTNGHMALELALQAFGLHGQVITTPFTFLSTTLAILRSGLTPVFCDIDPETFNLDPTKVEALITPQTSAILAVHVYGTPCNVDAIQRLAAAHGLKVFYDAAHAFGVHLRGKGIGGYGDAACFSFHATKVFHTAEGGGICLPDADLAKRVAELRNFGIEDGSQQGTNAKMDELRAAMGLCNLRHIEEEISKRARAAARYRERLAGIEGIQLAPILTGVRPNFAYFPIVFHAHLFGASRDQIFDRLAACGIMARKYFYPLTSVLTKRSSRWETPVADAVSRNILCLPLYPDLSLNTVDKICNLILQSR